MELKRKPLRAEVHELGTEILAPPKPKKTTAVPAVCDCVETVGHRRVSTATQGPGVVCSARERKKAVNVRAFKMLMTLPNFDDTRNKTD